MILTNPEHWLHYDSNIIMYPFFYHNATGYVLSTCLKIIPEAELTRALAQEALP